MGKKGKKGKKGKGKGGKKKEPQMTFQEAILAYKINIVEKKLDDVKYEVRGWEEKNRRALERNERLKSEQELLIEHLLKQAKEFQKLFDGEHKNKDDVISTMKAVWQRRRERENEIADEKEEIKKKEEEIGGSQSRVSYWQDFRDRGQHEQQKHISLLEQELADLQSSFEEMASHLKKSLDTTKDDIKKRTDDTLDKQKYLASEKAMAQLDKHSRQEVLDNDWLKREVEIHSREADELQESVTNLERKNLLIMSELFDCRVEDLKISRNFYLTQFEEDENLDENGILEMDLKSLTLEQRLNSADLENRAALKEHADTDRPKSAMLQAIEDKLLPMLMKDEELYADEEDEEDDADSTDMDVLGDDFFLEDINDYLKLGPVELKLLNVSGKTMPIHDPIPLSKEEIQAKDFKPDEWPVTQPMLKEII